MPVRPLACALVLAAMAASAPGTAATFRYAGAADVETLDPDGRFEIFTLGFLHAIYEPLVRYDRDLHIEPALAASWTEVDARTWRFTLRPGVRFQDGSPLTADDVAFTITRGKADGSAMAPTLAPVAAAVAVDPATVELRLARPMPTLLNDLAFVLVMSRAWSEAHQSAKPSNLRTGAVVPAHVQAMGTGPYRLVRRESDVATVLEANPGWWDKADGLPRVEYHPIKDSGARVAALLSGAVDFIDPVPLQDVPRLRATPGLTVRQAPELRTMFLGMDQARPVLTDSSVKDRNPFQDRRVRQAFYQAIDVDAIKARVMRGAAEPTGSMIAPGVVGYDPALEARLPYDLAAAKALMAEAGYPDGFALGMDCPNDRWVNDEDVCRAVAAMLARIGVRIDLHVQTRGLFLNKVLKQDTSFYLLGWTPGDNDASDVLGPILSPRQGGAGFFNLGGYSNPRVTELAGQALVETDPARRNALIREALTLHAQDIGHIPLYRQYTTWAYRSGIDLVQRADGVLPLWQVRMPQ